MKLLTIRREYILHYFIHTTYSLNDIKMNQIGLTYRHDAQQRNYLQLDLYIQIIVFKIIITYTLNFYINIQ